MELLGSGFSLGDGAGVRVEDGGYHEFWVLQTKISILGYNGTVYKPVGGWVVCE